MKKRILSLALALVMMLSLLPATAQAAASSGTCGTSARWSLDSAGTLTISGTGSMNSYSSGTTPWNAKRAQIKKVVVQSGITSLGYAAFSGCTNLKTVTLPTTLTDLGAQTFNGCTSLTTIKLPSKLKTIGHFAFMGCASLTTITFPASLESIGEYAFINCSKLKSAVIPAGITTLPESLFSMCGKLETITLPAGLEEIQDRALFGTKLKTVTYKGTSAQWKKVSVGKFNTPLTAATLKCTGTAATVKKYTVTFNANGGTVATKSSTVTPASGAVLPDPGLFLGCKKNAEKRNDNGSYLVNYKFDLNNARTAVADYLKLLESSYSVKLIRKGAWDLSKYGFLRQTYAYNYTGTSKTVKNFTTSIEKSEHGEKDGYMDISCAVLVTVKYVSDEGYAVLYVEHGEGLSLADSGKKASVTVRDLSGTSSSGTGGSVTPTTPTEKICRVCNGSGRTTCLTCSGLGHLNGHTCPSALCVNGKKMCFTCGGDGRL